MIRHYISCNDSLKITVCPAAKSAPFSQVFYICGLQALAVLSLRSIGSAEGRTPRPGTARPRLVFCMHAWLVYVAPFAQGAPAPFVPGYNGYGDAWIDTSSGSVNLASSNLANAAACGIACDTQHKHECLGFSWRQSDRLCVLQSGRSTHSQFRCCSCGTSSDCQGFAFYEKYYEPPSPPKPPPRPPPGCGNVEVMVVLDRSNNYNAKTWNTVVIPTVKSITDAVQPSAATNTKLGVVVYPVSNGDRGDQSGGAKVVAGLSHSRSAVDGMVSSVERGVQLNGKKYCVRSPSSSLEWPCGGWTFG